MKKETIKKEERRKKEDFNRSKLKNNRIKNYEWWIIKKWLKNKKNETVSYKNEDHEVKWNLEKRKCRALFISFSIEKCTTQ